MPLILIKKMPIADSSADWHQKERAVSPSNDTAATDHFITRYLLLLRCLQLHLRRLLAFLHFDQDGHQERNHQQRGQEHETGTRCIALPLDVTDERRADEAPQVAYRIDDRDGDRRSFTRQEQGR